MRIRILIVALVAALAAFGAVGKAKAAPPSVTDVIQLCVTTGGTHYISDGGPLAEDEADCEATDAIIANPFGSWVVSQVCIGGTTYLYADDDPLSDLFSELNDNGFSGSAGACVSPAAQAPPPNIFLCYSTYQTDPGVWSKAEAEVLLKQGYWLPYAVPGNVPGGTNLGSYHLVCNLAAGQAAGDSFVGGDGTVLGPSYAGDEGLYPKVGP